MAELDRPRIRVDFNEMVEQDVFLLSRDDVVRDSSGARVVLETGLRVYLYDDDLDESGAPGFLLATGIVEVNDAQDWSAGVRWRCRIDRWESS